MAAKSNHYGDIFAWIQATIHSCYTPEQCRTAMNLITNYDNMFRGIVSEWFDKFVIDRLYEQCNNKYIDLCHIKKEE